MKTWQTGSTNLISEAHDPRSVTVKHDGQHQNEVCIYTKYPPTYFPTRNDLSALDDLIHALDEAYDELEKAIEEQENHE